MPSNCVAPAGNAGKQEPCRSGWVGLSSLAGVVSPSLLRWPRDAARLPVRTARHCERHRPSDLGGCVSSHARTRGLMPAATRRLRQPAAGGQPLARLPPQVGKREEAPAGRGRGGSGRLEDGADAQDRIPTGRPRHYVRRRPLVRRAEGRSMILSSTHSFTCTPQSGPEPESLPRRCK